MRSKDWKFWNGAAYEEMVSMRRTKHGNMLKDLRSTRSLGTNGSSSSSQGFREQVSLRDTRED